MMSQQMKSSSTNSRHVDEDERPVYNCPYCSKVFRDPSSWSLHKRLHTSTELFRCQLCSYTCRVKKYLARHMKYHRPPTKYTCEICGKAFHFRCKMESHMRVHTKEKPFVCEVCDKAFSSSYSLSGHMLTHTDQKPFQCSFCKYACRDSSTLRKHVQRHVGASKVYECQICNKSYKCKWQLKTHLEEKHFGVEPQRYPCQLCDKLFKSKYNVDKHIKSVHEKSLSCECDVCGHVISNKSNLVQHMKRHVDVSPYKCTFTNCGRRFKDKGDLRRHAIIHSPARQHACGACGRLFARRRRLARHAQQHAAHAAHVARARTAECPHCGVLFYSKNYLLLHIKKKHDRKRNKFICDLCDFTTSNKPSLVMHLKYRHCGSRDIKCQICNKEYKKFECLKRHYLNTHNIVYNTSLKEPDSTSVEVKEEPDDEEVVGYHPEIDLLEIHKEELKEPEYSDPIIYSETVLSEDVSRSIMQRDKRRIGEPENEFDSLFIDHIIENPDKTVVKFDKCKEEGRVVDSRESSVEIDVEKLDKYEDSLGVSSVEESDVSVEGSVDYCLEDPGMNSIENSGENILENFVKPVKIFVEKLDQNIIKNAVKMNASKLGTNIAKKSAKVTVEKLDIDGLRKNSVGNLSVSKPKKYNTKYNSLMKNNNLKVRVEKLDVNRLKKLRKIGMRKMNKNTMKKIRVKQSDRSYVVNINKNDLVRRNSIKRRKKRGVKPVKDLYIKPNNSVESTPEPDITDYSKSVLSEDISRCLQERAGRAPGEPENRLESIFIDHYMEKADNNSSSEQEWEVSAYSRRVLSEDVSRSVMRRDRRVAGDPQADIDRLFIDHVMEKPDKHSVELVKENIDTQKERYVKRCVEKMLQRTRAKNEAAVLEETRQKYNERINELSMKSNKKDHVKIKYFKNKSTDGGNDNIDTGDDGNDEHIDDQIVQNDSTDATNDENYATIDDDVNTNDEQIVQNDNVVATNDENDGIIGDQIADNDNNDTRDDEGIKKNNKINFNTHQCYICFELFKTKADLTHHCKEHFQICNLKMLKKCPYCGYVTNFDMKRHLKLKHDVKVDLFNAQITETHNEEGSKYYLQTQSCKLEVIPSINNLNRKAYMKLDEINRLNKTTEITTAKIMKNGTEWVVDKDILRITKDFQLPEFSTEEYMSLNISGDKYEDMLKKLSFLAKKRGLKMLFPCNECDKVCRKMSGLVLHNRIHEANPKPFKRKVWKDKALIHRNINRNVQKNRVKVITRVRNSENYKEFVENQIKRRRIKTLHVEDAAGTTSNVVTGENVSVNSGKLPENRFAEPKPIENNHKCDKELMEFYKSNIKGGDVEFWQFLKIFNKMSRENVNDFDELEARTDFGIHVKDTTVPGNTEIENNVNSDNGNIKSANSEEGGNTSSEIEIDSNIGKMKMYKNAYKRVLMISKRERQRRDAIKNELRKRIECDNVEVSLL